MQYKTELHCHTSDVSRCAHMDPKLFIEKYVENRYDTLVLTNHYSPDTFALMEDCSWKEKNKHYLNGYREAVKNADGRINVLLGMEFRNAYTCNDYLVYGITEEFIFTNSCSDEKNFLKMHLKEFVQLAHENHILVYQAHPFRNKMTVVNPENIDGIETMNCHQRHDSRNDIAKQWAEKYHLSVCGGSDCHNEGDEARGGIYTDAPIKSNADLLDALSRDIRLIVPEDFS